MSLYKFPRASSYPKEYWLYLQFYTSKNPVIRYAFLKRLEKALEISYNDLVLADSVLEIGPGPGFLFLTLSQFTKNVIGLDLLIFHIEGMKHMIRSEGIASNVTLVRGDVRKLPFKDESLDLLYCMSVLEHVPLTAVTELYRILKPSGVLVVGIPIDTLLSRLGRSITGVGGHEREVDSFQNSYIDIRTELAKLFEVSHTLKVPHSSLPDVLSLYEVIRCKRKILVARDSV